MPDPLPPETEEPELETEFDVSYQTEITAIPPTIRIVMEKIAFRIKTDGVTIDEACLLCNVDTEWLAGQIEKYPVIARALAKKDLEYRVKLARPLNRKAAAGDTKLAQYLLDLKTPKTRKGAGDSEESGDLLALAISHIQEHGDSSPLVRRETGAAVLVTSSSSATRLMNKIKHVLDKK